MSLSNTPKCIQIYREICGQVMNNTCVMIETHDILINPTIIMQLINGSEGITYNNIINEVLASKARNPW